MTTTVTLIGSGQSTALNATINVVTTVAVAAGECIVGVVINGTARTVSAISDNGGGATTNTYTKGPESNAQNDGVCIFYCLNPAALASGRTFRVTLSGNNDNKNLFLFKLNGTAAALVNQNTANLDSSATPSVSTTASVAAGLAVFGGMGDQSAATATNPGGIWTSDYAAQVGGNLQSIAHGITSGSGVVTYNPTISGSSKWDAAIAAFSSVTAISGTASITEADDTGSSAATLKLQATASITEAGDTSNSAATLKITADAAITEAGDTLVAAAWYPPRVADANITEEGDTLLSSGGAHPIQADASITEAADTSSSTAGLKIQAQTVLLEAADTLASAAFVPLSLATLIIDEDDDTLVSASRLRPPQRLPQGPPFDADYGAATDGFYGKYYG